MRLHDRRILCLFAAFACPAPLGSAQAYQVGGSVSAVAGGTCVHSDQDGGALPAVRTSATCFAELATAYGATVADLRSGSLGLEVFATPAGSTADAAAQSNLLDTLTFSVPGGAALGAVALLALGARRQRRFLLP